MKSKIRGVLKLATRLAAAGPSWASRFEWGACVRGVDDLYDSLLG